MCKKLRGSMITGSVYLSDWTAEDLLGIVCLSLNLSNPRKGIEDVK